jgi:hypothetical protein
MLSPDEVPLLRPGLDESRVGSRMSRILRELLWRPKRNEMS